MDNPPVSRTATIAQHAPCANTKQMNSDATSDAAGWTTTAKVLVGVMGVLMTAHISIHLWDAANPLKRVNWPVAVIIFALFAFANALYAQGWKRAIAFLAITCIAAWSCEAYGLHHSWLFGTYYYTELLGPRLAGVPLVVPLAYFMMMYPSYVITNLMVFGHPVMTMATTLPRVAAVSLLTALVMTAWDLTNDPLMADQVKAWVWPLGGPYFNIPLQNFRGWILVVFIVVFGCRITERFVARKPLGPPWRIVTLGSLIGYGLFLLTDTIAGFPSGTRIIAPFAMGIPLLTACIRLYDGNPEKTGTASNSQSSPLRTPRPQ